MSRLRRQVDEEEVLDVLDANQRLSQLIQGVWEDYSKFKVKEREFMCELDGVSLSNGYTSLVTVRMIRGHVQRYPDLHPNLQTFLRMYDRLKDDGVNLVKRRIVPRMRRAQGFIPLSLRDAVNYWNSLDGTKRNLMDISKRRSPPRVQRPSQQYFATMNLLPEVIEAAAICRNTVARCCHDRSDWSPADPVPDVHYRSDTESTESASV
ncbi:PREDICTED: uncharacterized protein LOC109477599 [Branchiostoma belcheri]|uniref:Uncharacterized protein LOC109477599 n=1 Tax=Branchiostoma belcheri TaxID=7741 RepID=A0A6P4ZCU9_BRABE|nr:PREDICTED: uncharacterized protein LOC109477599 [Branchiostoma belcheri]XP_019634498.1 PREDICTED: uncharacterized protein LOC109477599 [Branchiostoma belcheri]XP_019634499.1 PREDICTED: uncharacterized protein LOC109477599 [Branchiostoma belcheri]XP_019634500.1 PREDICTED: uncharacterized protein LOC109477599 [Branchiostoma belcheri]